MRTYNGPEHESLRAVWRCMVVNFGLEDANRRVTGLMQKFDARSARELSPFAANYCRKHMEKMLPIRGDYA